MTSSSTIRRFIWNAVGADLGETMGNIIAKSYQLMVDIKPDAVLVLGDTNSCLFGYRRKAPAYSDISYGGGQPLQGMSAFPEETNRRIVDIISDVNMAYSEHARRYLADCGLPKERTYVTGSPMAEVLHANLEKIEASDIHKHLGLEKENIYFFPHTERRISTPTRISGLCSALLIRWLKSTICRYFIPVIRAAKSVSKPRALSSMSVLSDMSRSAFMIITACR